MRQIAVILLATLFLRATPGDAADPSLTITFGASTRNYTASELLARPDAAEVSVPAGIAYDHAITFRAVPLLPLLAALSRDGFDTLEARATDGFVAQVPLALVLQGAKGGATAWIAVEPPDRPWPNLLGKSAGPGPFFLIWEHPERSGVSREQWPYALATLTAVESPVHRWPQLAVESTLPADAPARRGQAVFIAQCLPCHKLNGGGSADFGPDLGRPMNATAYLTSNGLRALVRNPKAVRSWPQQQMPAFPPTIIPDADLDDLIAYLRAQSPR